MNRPDVWIVVPAFNEGPAIATILSQLTEQGYTVAVVDDGSKDDTARQVLAYPVTLLRHSCNLGQGAALQTGISYALLQPETRYIVTFDADGQHDVEDIPRLLAPLRAGTHDVVLGSRFLEPGHAIDIDKKKQALLRLAVHFTRLTTRLTITDTHNGLRAFTAAAAAQINITQNRMAHASEILEQIASGGLRYCEIPVTIRYTSYSRAKGQSVLDSVNILWDTMRMRVR
jgi:polyprenyl-phospho-N-acetylgalactosaminyl synthase